MQIMYMSILNNTKKMFKKKIKNAKTHGNNSYKKRKKRKRKNNTENKKRNRHFKNKTMKNKKMKKILFRVKKKIMDEMEKNIRGGGEPDVKLNTVLSISTNAVPVADTTGTDAGVGSGRAGVGTGRVGVGTGRVGIGTGRAALKLKKILGNFKLIQFHK